MATNKDTSEIINKLYPIVVKSISKNESKFLNTIGQFFNNRHKEIYDIAPYANILFNKSEEDKIYASLELDRESILNILKNTSFYGSNLKSVVAASEPYVEIIICIIKYFICNNKRKQAEMTTIYLLFTGKFYSSLYALYWKFPPNRSVMDFVINNMLTNKFDLKTEGTIFGVIKKMSITYLSTYETKFKKANIIDEDFRALIQQLRDRENSFLKNIANLYYQAAENKEYLNYETDNESEDNYRLTDNDSAKAARITDATMSVLVSQKVSLKRCNICKDTANGIKPELIMNVMESILADKQNLPDLRKLINILICDFMLNNPGKLVGGSDFIVYSVKPKPNTKSEMLIEAKRIMENWLMRYCEKYRNNSKRPATLSAIYKSVLMYIVLTISEVALK